jgi:TolB-like protein/Flp pilus assembly protein TadD
MSDAGKAVFLSYAREDTTAAGRIAEALRSQGVEVWFDQNELRGGDAWDQKIRRQIAECVLFLPIISRHTQERHKGYFRLEWKLAVEQTHQMAEGMAFIAPVVVDDTPEGGAVVPPEFMRVQWTRLPGALPTPQLVEQVKRLLDAPPIAPAAARPAFAGTAPRRKLPAGLAAAAVLALAGIGYFAFRPSAPAAVEPGLPADKSIAVLPFANMSADKDNSAVMADGIHDDILINLSLIREFRIPTSVDQYRGTTKPSQQIARELKVAYIMKGSVARDANQVRVTVQLVDARTDELKWSKPYDGTLANGGLFTLQAEIAKEVAATLKTVLSPEEKSLVERRPTENSAAYALFLQARDLEYRATGTLGTYRRQVELLKQAVALDPKFADAWANLARYEGYIYFQGWEMNEHQAAAKQAIDTALRLQPGSPEVIKGLAYYYYYAARDFERAAAEASRLITLRPNSAEGYGALAGVQRRQGKWLEALKNQRREVEFNAVAPNLASNLADTLMWGRRYDDAIAARRERLRRTLLTEAPESAEAMNAEYALALTQFTATGQRKEMEAFLGRLTSAPAESPAGIRLRLEWARYSGSQQEAVALDRRVQAAGTDSINLARFGAETLMATGDPAAARARLGSYPAEIKARLEQEPLNQTLWFNLAMMQALLGQKEDAVKSARRVLELVPEASDANSGATYSYNLALVYAWTGDKDRAIAEIARLLQVVHGTPGVHVMRTSVATFPLHGDPRFEALLNDPKNNAPLF